MTPDEIIKILLANRGLVSPADIAGFFHPVPPDQITLSQAGLSPDSVDQAISLIRSHIQSNHPIAVYGDYDVDGICSTAILWETLHSGYSAVFPHIPHRREEGYGLSVKGIDHCLQQGAKLIITVDNGIVSHSEIEYANSRGAQVIVIDHHESSANLPPASVIVHSTQTCAAALTWLFSREYRRQVTNEPYTISREQLSLVALAVICDIVPLIGINRSFAKSGLEELNGTSRPGLLALIQLAGLHPPLTSYHVGFIIGPRLNAMGRLEHALDSLRLLCTHDFDRAMHLALTLTETNRTRQDFTQSGTELAISRIDSQHLPDLIVVADASFDQGIIGLIASKLVEKFYRPAVAISIGEVESKASARSVAGFHITDHLRTASHLLKGVGGHSMAAGFTVENTKLDELISFISRVDISPDLLVRQKRIDAQIPLSAISYELYARLKEFEPHGLGNPHPVFSTSQISVVRPKLIGQSQNHLKFQAGSFDAIYFNAPPSISRAPMSMSNIVYTINENNFNGRTNLQLIIKELNPQS